MSLGAEMVVSVRWDDDSPARRDADAGPPAAAWPPMGTTASGVRALVGAPRAT